MTKQRFFIFTLWLVGTALFSVANVQSPAAGPVDSVDGVAGNFEMPPSSYAPVPLYVWNGQVTREEIDVQLADLKEKGFGGVFVHPRPGMVTEYLSTEWFDLFEYTVAKGEQLGLSVWIYDENSYPAGFAGGHVPDRFPETYNEGQGLRASVVEKLPADLTPYTLVLKQTGNRWEEVKQPSQAPGRYYLFEKTVYPQAAFTAGHPYVDVLKPGVTQRFLDLTMTRGYERCASQFGRAIPGMFSDEPLIYAPRWEEIRWSPTLFDEFSRRWGYDLRLHLPSLVEESGDWKRVRHNYYQTLLWLFVCNWAQPMAEYCRNHRLKWTGHYWEHEWPDPENCPDSMALSAYFDQPGIDLLFGYYDEKVFFPATSNNWPQPQFGCARSVKELASIANQLGKERSLCEMYGAGGWEFTFEEMKRYGDWAYALGVNFLCQHLSFMTIQGARKYDHPLSFSYHASWWSQYRELNDYFRRLSFALSAGRQINRTLVIEPTTTSWMYAQKGVVPPRLGEVGQQFQDFLTGLEKHRVEYDLASEHLLARYGSVEGGVLKVGDRTYDRIVIPSVTESVDRATLDLLRRSVGSRLISLARVTRVDGKAVESPLFPCRELTLDGLAAELATESFGVIKRNPFEGNLFHQRRELADGQVLFFSNADKHTPASGTFRVKGASALSLNLQTGGSSPYPTAVEGGFITLSVDIPPSGSLLLLVSNRPEGRAATAPPVPVEYQTVPPRGPMAVQPTQSNVLTLDFCDLILDGRRQESLHTVEACHRLFTHYGFKGNPWNSTVQFKQEFAERTFPEGSGYEVEYFFDLSEGTACSTARLVVENNGAEVYVNNTRVEASPGQWWLDTHFNVYDAGRSLKPGRNTVRLTVSPMNVLAEIEPIYLLGDFSLQSAAKGWRVTPSKPLKAGSWKAQGWPFYPASVDYTQRFLLRTGRETRVKLTDWSGAVAEIRVNGQRAGAVYLPPYELEVTEWITNGNNEITVRVYGSNKNLLGPFHGKLIDGVVTPGQWMGVTHCPAGADYQQLDYGLMVPFEVEQQP